jgi:hypothetical protein
MTRRQRLRPEFVTFAPTVLEPGVLYVSMEYATALHACCCGCGNKVITPLAPDRWRITFDGKRISLYPSVGNRSFACRSHYWIDESTVVWLPAFTSQEVAESRAGGPAEDALEPPLKDAAESREPTGRWWRRLLSWMSD